MTASVHPSAEQLQDQLRSELVTRFGVEDADVTAEMTFGELGLDSLALVELSDVLQSVLEIPIADDDFSGEQKIAEVVTLLQDKLVEHVDAQGQV
ncbi:acyl carrier protein [Streptomyces europaeiscabiei]|uniref:Acyl carrier protein n=1 Tax=Streptomyces europaeiscabiei TaxID=146819 RepID=A0AAJ2PLT7_9ACTN|nr:acyl carrier protein [Streptomyces europaeiscabiei]MDX3129437.1 acyl carrier protein [Streptomyces europaeiscabiei]